ncbi:MAG: hypothetical protein JWQ35_425 [Bacteriovoracaceae bacterium]|nr:hypothetical protein [Bacteriovoracaceae bacterium]
MKSMPFYILIAIICSGFISCTSSSSSVSEYNLPLKPYKLGEYLQVENANSLITVNRSDEQTGLVRIELSTETLSVLDPSAKEARDIHMSSGKITYRVDQEIRLWNNKPISLMGGVSRLRTFNWMKTFGRITYENLKLESRSLTFREDGKVISDSEIPGSGRAELAFASHPDCLVFQNSEGLFWGYFGNESEGIKESWPIEKGKAGAYVTAREVNGTLSVAYFDDDAGILKLAKKSNLAETFATDVVDGTSGQTYRGMDIAIFNDHGEPGLIYLDGWALKTRLARFFNGKWKSIELPLRGAVGFYNQIIAENDETITIGSHNFRTQIDDYHQIFENLATFKLDIRGRI